MVDIADFKNRDGSYDMAGFTRAATIENVQKIVKPSLTVAQKIECINLAKCPKEFNKSSFRAAQRIMKQMVQGGPGGNAADYPEEIACLWAMLVSVEQAVQEAM